MQKFKFFFITDNSVSVKKNSIFFAIKGYFYNKINSNESILATNINYIFLAQKYIHKIHKDKSIYVNNIKKSLSKLLAFNFNKKTKNITCITGTNGKSSITLFSRQIYSSLKKKSCSISTLGIKTNDNNNFKKFNLTTPSNITLHKLLIELFFDNYTHIILETSSHALDQYRTDNICIKTAVFSSFSHDHLDYHRNINKYFFAKSRLFSNILFTNKTAILNSDISKFQILIKICLNKKIKIIDFGIKSKCLSITNINKQIIKLFRKTSVLNIKTKLQIYNILASIGFTYTDSKSLNAILNTISCLKPLKGRLELTGISKYNGYIYIDYAHTPDALMLTLTNLKKNCKNKLIILFGCGGERDKNKRIKMPVIANKISNIIYITNDNPRNENATKIRASILKNCQGLEIANRKHAIIKIITELSKGDILLIAGKGHENYQIFGTKKLYFSDHKIVKKYLKY